MTVEDSWRGRWGFRNATCQRPVLFLQFCLLSKQSIMDCNIFFPLNNIWLEVEKCVMLVVNIIISISRLEMQIKKIADVEILPPIICKQRKNTRQQKACKETQVCIYTSLRHSGQICVSNDMINTNHSIPLTFLQLHQHVSTISLRV